MEDVRAVADGQGDQQRRSPMIQVCRPHHLVTACNVDHASKELEQGWFVIGDSLREQTVSGVNHNTVVVSFAGINGGQ